MRLVARLLVAWWGNRQRTTAQLGRRANRADQKNIGAYAGVSQSAELAQLPHEPASQLRRVPAASGAAGRASARLQMSVRGRHRRHGARGVRGRMLVLGSSA